jgi:hypothetical protein
MLQRFVVGRHERAIRRLLIPVPPARRIGIVGGGLFPRTAIILGKLLPESDITLIDLSAKNLAQARQYTGTRVEYLNERFDPAMHRGFDLIVIPLSLVGNRELIYRRPPATAVLVHDWIWRRRGRSVIVSWLLLKRLNMVGQ